MLISQKIFVDLLLEIDKLEKLNKTLKEIETQYDCDYNLVISQNQKFIDYYRKALRDAKFRTMR